MSIFCLKKAVEEHLLHIFVTAAMLAAILDTFICAIQMKRIPI